jgi:hypothetical protein
MTKKLTTKILLSLAALATTFAAMAPAASAEGLEFEPGSVFAKAHGPLSHNAPFIFQSFMGQFFPIPFIGKAEEENWINEIVAKPELDQAGGHPDFSTNFDFVLPPGKHLPFHPRTVVAEAPAGSVGNPRAVPRCEAADFHLTVLGACPPETQIGEAITRTDFIRLVSPISSLVPFEGVPALLAYKSFYITVLLRPEIRSAGDYGLNITAEGIPEEIADLTGSTVTLWGVPHDPIHDQHRVNAVGELGGSVEGAAKPFLSAPTNCETGPIELTVKSRSWEQPESWIEEPNEANEPSGCDQVPFEPTLSARPSTNAADSPSGLEVDLHVPQNEGCAVPPALQGQLEEFEAAFAVVVEKRHRMKEVIDNGEEGEFETAYGERLAAEAELKELSDQSFYDCGLATSHLKDTTVTLPEGLVVNPSSANGLDSCSSSEAGLTTPLGQIPAQFNGEPANCPDASRIGAVEVDTPLLDNPMRGSVFLADPYDNPYQSFLGLYIAVDDEKTGIVATLAGRVDADPATGRLVATFQENPQLPFEHFFIHLKQGPHAPLRTPSACGTYETAAQMSGYANPDSPVTSTDQWSIDQGAGGAGCANPVAPELDAGSVSPLAGLSTPTVVNLRRADGSQEFSKVNLTLPPGLTGRLAGISQCPESALATAEAKTGQEELSSPSCPANSRIGTVYVQAGSGPDPYNTKASAYLGGPYKGAPASIAIVAPATAGPFDLGTVVVRVALSLDPATGQITATSDEIPHILKGIPLDIRATKIVMDRDQFTRNGTSCDPSAFSGEVLSTLGQGASLSERFQLAECSSLSFKPKLAIRLFGSTKRGGHPALRGVLRMPEGGANIDQASVTLPRSEFIDQGHFGTVCTRVQFAEGNGNGSACPPASIYGSAVATSPLVDYPLEGSALLRSSNHKLPDLVVALHGPASQPIQVAVAARVDSVKGRLRSTFEGVPDLPVSSFVLNMRGGKKGLFQNSTDICQGIHRATALFDGQNGKAADLAPALKNAKCGKARKAAKRRARQAR